MRSTSARPADEAHFFWYEDPYRDTGGAVEGHKRLRERLRTPLLVCEHVRGLEAKAAFVSPAAAISSMPTRNTIWESRGP